MPLVFAQGVLIPMFYKPGEYRINQENEFISASTGLSLDSGDLAALEAVCDVNDISPIETYGREIVSQNREVVVVGGVKKLYKSAVVRI